MPDALANIFELTKDVGGILLMVFYVAIVLWTYKDARRRIDDPILIATSVATAMLPIVGVLIYMMLRPPEYIADARERELEIRAMERELGRQERCPYCKSHIESNFLSCPVCMTKLRKACGGCEHPLDPRWAMCPFCETEVPRPARDRSGAPSDRRTPRSSGAQPTAKRAARAPRTEAAPKQDRSSSRGSTSSAAQGPTQTAAPTTNDLPGGAGITTEPFQAVTPNRITGSASRSTDQPTMAHPVVPTPES